MMGTLRRTLALFCLALLLSLPMTARAAELDYVTDDAGILTDSERTSLEARAAEISREYGCGLYLVTVDNFWSYGGTPFDAACNIYRDYDLGVGEDRDGFILMLSMRERDYALAVYGPFASEALNDFAQERLEKVFLDDFGDDRWYDGFADCLDRCEKYLDMASRGRPLNPKTDPASIALRVGIAVALSCLVALIVCLYWKGQMKSVRKGSDARAYMVADSNRLRVREDRFTHATQVRRRIEQHTSSGGGRSSHSGGGFSGRSGKF